MSVFLTEKKVNNYAVRISTVHAANIKIYQVKFSIQYVH